MGMESMPALLQGGQTLAGLANPGASPIDLVQGGLSLGSQVFGQMMPKDQAMLDVPPVNPENKQYSFIGGGK